MDEVINAQSEPDSLESTPGSTQNTVLDSFQNMKNISLHPSEIGGVSIDDLELGGLLSQVLTELKKLLGNSISLSQVPNELGKTEKTKREICYKIVGPLLNFSIKMPLCKPAEDDSDRFLHLGSVRALLRILKMISQLQECEEPRNAEGSSAELRRCEAFVMHLKNAFEINRLLDIAQDYSKQYHEIGNLYDLNSAISFHEHALVLMPSNYPDLVNAVCRLDALLKRRYEHIGDWNDLSRSFEYLSATAMTLPHEHKDIGTITGHLGVLHIYQFARLGNLNNIDQATRYLEGALSLCRGDDKELVAHLTHLGDAYTRRFQKTGDLNDIQYAIVRLEQAVTAAPCQDRLPYCLTALGSAYEQRFNQTGLPEDLKRAIECQTYSIRLSERRSIHIPLRLDSLAGSLRSKYASSRHFEDLDYQVECLAQAIALTPSGHPNWSSRLNDLGNSYLHRFEHSAKSDDIEKAIECLTQAVVCTPSNHPRLPQFLTNLGGTYLRRFQYSGDPTDIDKSVDYRQQAVRLLSMGDKVTPACLSNLGSTLMVRFDYHGTLSDIHGSIECHSQAVRLVPPGHAALPVFLSNLGIAHRSLFDYAGNIDNIDSAIECLTHATLLSSNQVDLPMALMNLGTAYLGRYQRLERPNDLDQAIRGMIQAVELTPKDHADLPQYLTNLGVSFDRRFEVTENIEDVDNAIACYTESLNLPPHNHILRARYFNNLGQSYKSRFKVTGYEEDIREAVTHLEQAVSLTPEGHINMSGRLMNLGNALSMRFSVSRDQDHLTAAIGAHLLATDRLPAEHASMPLHLLSLGNSYMTQFQHFDDMNAYFQAISCFDRSSRSPVGHPQTRFTSARLCANYISRLSPLKSLETYQVAINMIPQLIWLGSTMDERYKQTPQIASLIQEATAVAIETKNYMLALEWLEQGRTIVWNQLLQLRSPVDDLASDHPELAKRLRKVAADLHSAASAPAVHFTELSNHLLTQLPPEQLARKHHLLAAEYDHLLAQVRALPKYEDFMLPKKAATFSRVAADHPIVIISTYESRCDVLALLPGESDVLHIPLTNMSYNAARTASIQIQNSLHRRGVRERGDQRGVKSMAADKADHFNSVLAGLWTDVAKPILQRLGYYMVHSPTKLPRITWCMTGPFSSLPIHAAGRYDLPMAKLSDYAISSYTPTLTALLNVDPISPSPVPSILAVSQEATPNRSALPQTVTELAKIQNRVHSRLEYTQLSKNDATVSRVLDEMEKQSCVHLACHAFQNLKSPIESGFHLQDGTLTLRDIMQRSFQDKQLAFLSACQTATGDDQMPDEAVHLASGMLVAGYPSVIATMWAISDRYAPLVADEVYAQLLNNDPLNPSDAAYALHYAVAKLKEEVGNEDFVLWVPYIHIGL